MNLKTLIKALVSRLVARHAGFLVKRFMTGYRVAPDVYARSAHKLVDIREDLFFFSLASPVIEHGRTYLYYDRLFNLYEAVGNQVRHADSKDKFQFLEVGVFRGGSSYFIASIADKIAPGRSTLFSVDTFEGHSAVDVRSDRDGGHTTGSFLRTGFEEVCNYLAPFPFARVIKGRIQDVSAQLPAAPFDLVHVDVDIFEPTSYCLREFGSRMKPGGMLLVDDYAARTCPGVKRAVDEFVQQHGEFFRISFLTGQCLLIKIK